MSRIRTIKPHFWVSEQVISCSPFTRLLFIGMWNFCDDNGVHPASFVTLKAEVLPADNMEITDIKKAIKELISLGLINEYMHSGKSYWIIPTWKQHQRIDRPTYKYPLPDYDSKQIVKEHSPKDKGVLNEDTTSALGNIQDISPTERNGMDSKGSKICEAKTSPLVNNLEADIVEIFHHWQAVMCHPKAILDKNRKTFISNALTKLKFTKNELKSAIDGCSKNTFNMGQNRNNKKYDSINLIFRDADHIERFINNNMKIESVEPHGQMEGLI